MRALNKFKKVVVLNLVLLASLSACAGGGTFGTGVPIAHGFGGPASPVHSTKNAAASLVYVSLVDKNGSPLGKARITLKTIGDCTTAREYGSCSIGLTGALPAVLQVEASLGGKIYRAAIKRTDFENSLELQVDAKGRLIVLQGH